jgi:hypothetical protein
MGQQSSIEARPKGKDGAQAKIVQGAENYMRDPQ